MTQWASKEREQSLTLMRRLTFSRHTHTQRERDRNTHIHCSYNTTSFSDYQLLQEAYIQSYLLLYTQVTPIHTRPGAPVSHSTAVSETWTMIILTFNLRCVWEAESSNLRLRPHRSGHLHVSHLFLFLFLFFSRWRISAKFWWMWVDLSHVGVLSLCCVKWRQKKRSGWEDCDFYLWSAKMFCGTTWVGVGARLELLRNKNRLIRSHDKNNRGLCLFVCLLNLIGFFPPPFLLCLTFSWSSPFCFTLQHCFFQEQ